MDSIAATPVRPIGFFARLMALPRWALGLLGGLLLLLLWYVLLGTMLAGISPDPGLRPTPEQLPAGGSAALGFAARLVDAQVNDRAFTPNDPFFFPTGLTRRTPAYQARIIETTHAVVEALAARPGAVALAEGARLLAVPADQWWLALGWPPIRQSSERAYRGAIAALVEQNRIDAAAPGNAGSESPRMDAHSRAAVAALADMVEMEARRGNRLMAGQADGSVVVQLSAARGTAHAAAMLLRGLRDDNAAAVRLSGKAARWGEALDALDAAAAQDPLMPGETDLIRAGYQLLLAGSALRAILQ